MTRTRGFGEVGETAQTMIRTSQESAGVMLDYAVRVQELNTTLAQRAVETWIDALRRQTALGQDATREIFGKAEEQGDALRSFYGQWTGMLWSFPFSVSGTRSFQRQGMRLVETATETARTAAEAAAGGVEAVTGAAVSGAAVSGGNRGLPIQNYDDVTVDEVVSELGRL